MAIESYVMPTIEKKSDIFQLLNDDMFIRAVAVSSNEDFWRERGRDPGFSYCEYFDSPMDDQGVGISLFGFTQKGNNSGRGYGTSVDVAKLYGDVELPFLVTVTDSRPYGTDADSPTPIGAFRTLSEALEFSSECHLSGNSVLHSLQENEVTGVYYQPEPEISIPPSILDRNLSNSRIEGALLSKIHAKSAMAPMLEDVLEICAIISDSASQITTLNPMVDSLDFAISINQVLFQGTGQIFGFVNSELKEKAHEWAGRFAVGVKDEATGVYDFYDSDGWPKDADFLKSESRIRLDHPGHESMMSRAMDCGVIPENLDLESMLMIEVNGTNEAILRDAYSDPARLKSYIESLEHHAHVHMVLKSVDGPELEVSVALSI